MHLRPATAAVAEQGRSYALKGMYPDWPNTDPATVRNEVHRRLLLLAKNVQMEAGKHGSVRYVAERSQVSHTMITRFVRGELIPSWRLSN